MATQALSRLTLEDAAALFVADPLGMVLFEYPWGEPGTALEAFEGPDRWQVEVLERLRAALHDPTQQGAIRFGIGSGHGIGKGTLMAWLIRWFITTRPHPQIVITANTATQLTTKTWRELAKWHRLSVFQDWFDWSQTSYRLRRAPETWFASAIPWSEEKPEAFQGAHDRYVLFGFDEASAIPDLIWDTAEGSMTTPQCLWIATGNLTRPTGRFTELFPGGRFQHRWQTLQVDSRTARMANQAQIAEWATDYGEDSDFFRVRVLGQKPQQAVGQFIGDDLIALARARLPVEDRLQPYTIGVDVARYGDDRSVILVRHGGRILLTRVWYGIETVRLTGYVCETIDAYAPHTPAVFIDGVGIGAGVVDQCRARGYPVHEVQAGAKAQDERHFANKRAEMWQRVKDWLGRQASLTADDAALCDDLVGPEYDYDTGKLRLEKKEDMKARGLASSDIGDALALTFAEPLALDFGRHQAPLMAEGMDYQPRGAW
jgi:hypothetical protein